MDNLTVYTGTKTIEAKVMNLGDYNNFKGWTLPDNENPLREGYIVYYRDGHISWSPKETFEEVYKPGWPVTNKRAFNTVELGTLYELPVYRVVDGKGIEETGEVLPLTFVRGSKLTDEDVEKREGTLHEHIISTLIHDLRFKNKLNPARETSVVITKLEEALFWQEERTRARESAGVLGTYKPHQS